jgi:hypothetical protein
MEESASFFGGDTHFNLIEFLEYKRNEIAKGWCDANEVLYKEEALPFRIQDIVTRETVVVSLENMDQYPAGFNDLVNIKRTNRRDHNIQYILDPEKSSLLFEFISNPFANADDSGFVSADNFPPILQDPELPYLVLGLYAKGIVQNRGIIELLLNIYQFKEQQFENHARYDREWDDELIGFFLFNIENLKNIRVCKGIDINNTGYKEFYKGFRYREARSYPIFPELENNALSEFCSLFLELPEILKLVLVFKPGKFENDCFIQSFLDSETVICPSSNHNDNADPYLYLPTQEIASVKKIAILGADELSFLLQKAGYVSKSDIELSTRYGGARYAYLSLPGVETKKRVHETELSNLFLYVHDDFHTILNTQVPELVHRVLTKLADLQRECLEKHWTAAIWDLVDRGRSPRRLADDDFFEEMTYEDRVIFYLNLYLSNENPFSQVLLYLNFIQVCSNTDLLSQEIYQVVKENSPFSFKIMEEIVQEDNLSFPAKVFLILYLEEYKDDDIGEKIFPLFFKFFSYIDDKFKFYKGNKSHQLYLQFDGELLGSYEKENYLFSSMRVYCLNNFLEKSIKTQETENLLDLGQNCCSHAAEEGNEMNVYYALFLLNFIVPELLERKSELDLEEGQREQIAHFLEECEEIKESSIISSYTY